MSDFNAILQLVCWVCLALVVYTYVGYPIAVWSLAAIFGRDDPPSHVVSCDLPRVSLLIAAHNEASIIAARIENALAMDYPRDRWEIAVATDGCTDETADVVREFTNRGVCLFEYRQRRGKTMVLNDSIPRLSGDVVILSDANTFTEPDAVRQLARWFLDNQVGVVCGRLILTDPKTGSNIDSLYWKYETFLKRCESRLGALLGANGGIYAIRRANFSPIPANTAVDDFVIPLTARLQSGCEIIYDSEAIAHEETPPDIAAEFRRRTRIGAGGFQSIGLLWPLLNPNRGWIAFSFLSHKILRWGAPFFLIGLLLSSAMLLDQPLYRLLFVGQVVFYTLAVLGSFIPPSVPLVKPLRLTTMFTGMNLALLLGFWRWLRGGLEGTWTHTVRSATESYPHSSHHMPGTPA